MSTIKRLGFLISLLLPFAPGLSFAAEPVGLEGKKIQLVVGFAAGGPSDIVARVVGAKLGIALHADIIVENRVGASGNLASMAVAQSAPNGLTLLLAPSAFAINETLFPNRRFEYAKDFAAVASLAETSLVLVAHPSLGVKDLNGLRAYAAQNDGAFYATAGQGTVTHLAGELFASLQATKLIPVHYKGGGDLTRDVLSGQVKVTFSTIPPVREFIMTGQLVGIATTGSSRDFSLPDIPTFIESGVPGYDVLLWLGLLAPRGTPGDVLETLAAASAEVLKDKEVEDSLRVQGFSSRFRGPGEFDDFVRSDIKRWNELVDRIKLPNVQ